MRYGSLIVLPVSVIVMFALLLPVAVRNGSLAGFYWIRFKLTGTSEPPKGWPERTNPNS